MSQPDAPAAQAGDLVLAYVHIVCCDAAVGLCGDQLSGGDQYDDATAATCPLCLMAEDLGQPCGAPFCDVGGDPLTAEVEFALLGTCRQCGCTDDLACALGCSWVPDPEVGGVLGTLCSACAPAATQVGAGSD